MAHIITKQSLGHLDIRLNLRKKNLFNQNKQSRHVIAPTSNNLIHIIIIALYLSKIHPKVWSFLEQGCNLDGKLTSMKIPIWMTLKQIPK